MRFLFSIIALLPQFCIAQSALGSWNIFSAKASLTERWGVFAEGRVRSLKFYNNFHYHEIKGGVSYALDKNFSLAVAGGKYDTYQEGGNFVAPKASDEVRLFEQLSMSQYLQRIKFEHRYRAEQRFTQNGYKNRFRYRLQSVVPINSTKVTQGKLYLSASAELFFTDTPTYFERLRTYIGIGYQFTDSFGLQTGYLHQFDYKLVDETGKDFIQVSLLWDIKLHKNEQEKIPTQVD